MAGSELFITFDTAPTVMPKQLGCRSSEVELKFNLQLKISAPKTETIKCL